MSEVSVAYKPILFVSSVNATPWGGAEELWSRAALQRHQRLLHLRPEGLLVRRPDERPHHRIARLEHHDYGAGRIRRSR